jgi:hypothetical protein
MSASTFAQFCLPQQAAQGFTCRIAYRQTTAHRVRAKTVEMPLGLVSLIIVNRQCEKLLATPELAPLGPGPRSGIQTELNLDNALDKIFANTDFSVERQQLIRALILLWHDHLDAAHKIAQEIDTTDGAFVHGIMHRREPDYSNAKYWFHRVGQHSVFPEIVARAKVISDDVVTARLTQNGKWDAPAFIDCCEEAAHRKDSDPLLHVLKQIQKIETEVLLSWFCK